MPYIGKKPADIIATVIDTTTGTFSGEVDAGSLDVSGNADIDGITNLDNTDIDGTLDVSGNLTVDTNTLFVDSANNSVGIGTTDIVNNSIYNSLRLGSAGNLQAYTSTSNGNIFIAEGAAINSAGNWEYLRSDFATYYRQGDGTHIWASSASGIDGNTVSFSERMRIDNNGNLFVGTTTVNPADNNDPSGSQLSSGGSIQTSVSNATPAIFNRGNDGAIIGLLRAGVSVGSIGVTNTDRLYIGTPDGSQCAIRFDGDTQDILPSNASGSALDNAISLGDSGTRFKDLYLSGNAGVGANPSSFNGGANNLVVGTGSGSEGISIYADNSSNSAIFFADTDSTTTGQINYQHASNAFTFHTNGGTERMRIDSSGNLLVGKTSVGTTTEGAEVRNNGIVAAARDLTGSSGSVLYLNRIGNTDGPIQTFYKDGSSVGSIGADDGDLYIGTGVTGLQFFNAGNRIIPFNTNTGSLSNNTTDLGDPNFRFKDLFLSGTAKIEKSGQALNLDTPSASQNVWMNFSDNGSVKWEIQKNTANVLNIYSYDASSTVMSFDGTGAITKPLQPAFQARPSSTLINISINTNVNLNFANEIFDKNADYNAGGSPSTFTAPVTGVYQLNLNAYILNLDTDASYFQISIITSNRGYDLVIDPNFSGDLNYYNMSISALADMDAGDTAYIQAYQSNGTAQTDISAGAIFSGYLVG